MSIRLQIALIAVTLIYFFFLTRNIKKQKLRTEYAVVWVLFSLVLIFMSLFPQIPGMIANLLGIATVINAIFLLIIFFLCCLVYFLYAKVSLLEEKLKNLIHVVALQNKEQEEKDEHGGSK